MFRINQFIWLPCAMLALATGGAVAESVAEPTLKQVFDSAWQRQPEALSQHSRAEAAAAQQESATRWTAEPVALEWSTTTDRLNQNVGRDETALGISVALWLPGERARAGALAHAQARSATSRVQAAQLRTAAQVREAYWAWQRTLIEHGLAAQQLHYAQLLAQDVSKRVRAGDLARADQHLADGGVAAAEVALAEAAGTLARAVQQLRALTGIVPQSANVGTTPTALGREPVAAIPADPSAWEASHPVLAELLDSAEAAQRAAELTQVQTRANPELRLTTSRERGLLGEDYQQSIALGIRIPLGSDSRNQARRATALADATEALAHLRAERDRLQGATAAARTVLQSTQILLDASLRRAQLARESRAFFQKAFALGEADLPTRLRVEREAMDAERQAARAGIDLAAAQSALRQSLGLLPE
jgi:cobalt-zinc-cadmium efflux system outer membrane protein